MYVYIHILRMDFTHDFPCCSHPSGASVPARKQVNDFQFVRLVGGLQRLQNHGFIILRAVNGTLTSRFGSEGVLLEVRIING